MTIGFFINNLQVIDSGQQYFIMAMTNIALRIFHQCRFYS